METEPTAPTQEELELRTVLRAIDKLMPYVHAYSTPEFNEIYRLMQRFTRNRCAHDIETDTIDIDPDRSQTIRYCKICMHTF